MGLIIAMVQKLVMSHRNGHDLMSHDVGCLLLEGSKYIKCLDSTLFVTLDCFTCLAHKYLFIAVLFQHNVFVFMSLLIIT